MDYHFFNKDSDFPDLCVVCGEDIGWVEHRDDYEWPAPVWTNVGEFDMQRFELGE